VHFDSSPKCSHLLVCRLLAEDSENYLYGVVIFKRLVSDFKQEARKKKYVCPFFKP
jgi:hypothetical protein